LNIALEARKEDCVNKKTNLVLLVAFTGMVMGLASCSEKDGGATKLGAQG
jgi:hypothetical protein